MDPYIWAVLAVLVGALFWYLCIGLGWVPARDTPPLTGTQQMAEQVEQNQSLEPLPVLPPEYVINPADRARELVKQLNACFQELHSDGVEIHIQTVSSWEDFVAGEEIRVYDEIRLDLKRWERV